jgi:hypothetical protein
MRPFSTVFQIYLDDCVSGILIPEDIIYQVVGISALTWFLGYIYY